eukprot:scaffold19481_cov112-Isochrysis_galbana.AAC.5
MRSRHCALGVGLTVNPLSSKARRRCLTASAPAGSRPTDDYNKITGTARTRRQSCIARHGKREKETGALASPKFRPGRVKKHGSPVSGSGRQKTVVAPGEAERMRLYAASTSSVPLRNPSVRIPSVPSSATKRAAARAGKSAVSQTSAALANRCL